MKKPLILSVLFISIIGLSTATAQKKSKDDNIDPIGIDCDQISVSISQTGAIKFEKPVELHSASLINKTTGEIEMDLPLYENGNFKKYQTMDLKDLQLDFDVIIEFEIIEEPDIVVVFGISEPCSRRIVIGDK